MNAENALEIQLRSFRDFLELAGGSSPGARVVELGGGVAGSVVPAVPDRSVIYFVATEPAHRGRGLATRLMAAALAEARGRGCATSSLQASAMGEPVYTALGYRTHFRFWMYERRCEARG